MYEFIRYIDSFCKLVKEATEDFSTTVNLLEPVQQAQDSKPSKPEEKKPEEKKPEEKKPEEQQSITKKQPPENIKQLEEEAVKTGGAKLINFVKSYGKDMSESTPNRAFIYDFPQKDGSTCVFDNRVVHFKTKLIAVPRQVHQEMRDDNYKAVQYIVKWIKTNMPDVASNKGLLENVTLNVIGQKGAEGSRLNYNFGFIQATVRANTDANWQGHVFIIIDHNTKDGKKVPFIWPYVSLTSFEKGINYWLNFLQRRGFLEAAKGEGMKFVEALHKGKYFDVPTKTVQDPITGKTKRVIDEENARKKREGYYRNGLRLRRSSDVVKGIQDFIHNV